MKNENAISLIQISMKKEKFDNIFDCYFVVENFISRIRNERKKERRKDKRFRSKKKKKKRSLFSFIQQ